MAFLTDFLGRILPVDRRIGASVSGAPISINIPIELYYKELAVHTAVSLISNAISKSEIKVFANGKPQKNLDYYLLNVSPNKNETSSVFWHRVINKMVRNGEAFVVLSGGRLYCADSYSIKQERPVLGDIYDNVTVGTFTFNRTFKGSDAYLIKLDDVNVSALISGMYDDYGKILSAAAKSFKAGNGQKYKIHIDAVKAGDDDFNKEFEEHISKQLKDYLQSENAIYPEFDGYELKHDDATGSRSASDFIAVRKDVFETVSHAFHIPDSMMNGNITNIEDVVGAFLAFGVDPYADTIGEALNKAAGPENYLAGNFYKIDTGKVAHRDVVKNAAGIANLISSGFFNIDEAREEFSFEPINEDWSKKHFITKNFDEIERFLNDPKGGE